jgi:hypothetical protein
MKKVLGILVLSLVVVGSLFAGGQTEAAAQAYKDTTGKTVSIVIQGRANYRSAYNTALLAGSKDFVVCKFYFLHFLRHKRRASSFSSARISVTASPPRPCSPPFLLEANLQVLLFGAH